MQDSIRLPKNIRQIGSFGDTYKIYVEDFVYTYVHQILQQKKTSADEVTAAVLLGNVQTMGNCQYVFISGAQRCNFGLIQGKEEEEEEGTPREMDPALRQQTFWGNIYQNMKEFFSDREILGWYISLEGNSEEMVPGLQQFFEATAARGSHFLYYEDAIEQDADFFVLEQHALQKISGYAVYYEKNPEMQEYMIAEREGMHPQGEPLTTSEEQLEDVAQNYRAIIQRINERPSRRRSQHLIYVAGVAVLVVVTATGITQIGNYKNLKMLENTLQTFSDSGTGQTAAFASEKGNSSSVSEKQNTKTADKSGVGTSKTTAKTAETSGTDSKSKDQSAKNTTGTSSGKNSTVKSDITENKRNTANLSAAGSGTVAKKNSTKNTNTTGSAGKTNSTAGSGTAGNKNGTANTNTTGSAGKTNSTAETGTASKKNSTANTGTKGNGNKSNAAGSTKNSASKSGTAANKNSAAMASGSTTGSQTQEYYIVRKGDSLVSISRRYYGNIQMISQICQLNHIENENMIYEGQKLKLPTE